MITIGERMAKIETTLEYIKDSMDENKGEHKQILDLVKKELALKADKSRVDALESRIKESKVSNREWIMWIPTVIMLLLTIFIFIRG